MSAPVACYVSGAGMFAGAATRAFKPTVMLWLEESGLGFDTRLAYYRERLPPMPASTLALKVCDPIEYYDPDWPGYRAAGIGAGEREEVVLARFVVERDAGFRDAADAAVYCFDEAGLGSGVNVMRFLANGKPVLGFYAEDPERRRVNLTNAVQLSVEFPDLVRLTAYRHLDEVKDRLSEWLRAVPRRRRPGAFPGSGQQKGPAG